MSDSMLYPASRTCGLRVRALRKSQRMIQKALGAKIGVTGEAISRIERGRVNIPYETLDRIAVALDCTVELVAQAKEEPGKGSAHQQDLSEIFVYLAALPYQI